MRKSNRTVLNRMSKWQYALLLLMLLTFTFYSLPTFFGEQPSLGLHGQQRLTTQQQMLLSDKHLTPVKVIEQPERVELVFASQGEQQRAKQLLEQQGVDSAALTLEFHSNAPAWITRLGADPIKLGLDLRGGSQLLIGVDVDFVIDNQTKNLVDTLRTRFREANLRGASVTRSAQGAVAVTLPEVAEQDSWLSIIKESAGTRQDQWKLTRSGNDLKLVLSDAERTLLVNNAVTQNLSILKKRINELGIVEASVVRQGQDGIRIELPGVHNPKQAKEVIGATASLAFYEAKADSHFYIADRNGQAVGMTRKPVLTGEHIVDARANMGEMGQPQVNIVLDTLGGSKMNQFSRQHVGKPMATVFTEYKTNAQGKLRAQSEVINVATIQSRLGSQFRITGIDNANEAHNLALLLRAGALIAPIQIVEERTIGPSLGQQNIDSGMEAIGWAMLVIVLFMGIYYRAFGWVANLALCMNLVLIVGIMSMIPGATMTLPGIAGIVLTLGMAVDANVLIYERIREEIRNGRGVQQAIHLGFDRAFSTIADSNVTSLITCVILFGIGTGAIKGFALTLGIGLTASMFTAITVSRAIINLAWGGRRIDKLPI